MARQVTGLMRSTDLRVIRLTSAFPSSRSLPLRRTGGSQSATELDLDSAFRTACTPLSMRPVKLLLLCPPILRRLAMPSLPAVPIFRSLLRFPARARCLAISSGDGMPKITCALSVQIDWLNFASPTAEMTLLSLSSSSDSFDSYDSYDSSDSSERGARGAVGRGGRGDETWGEVGFRRGATTP